MVKSHVYSIVKVISAILAVLFSLALIVVVFLEFILNPCGNEIIDSLSLRNNEKVVFFERNCGATTGYSYHLSIVPLSYQLSNRDKGNVIIYKGSQPDIKVNNDKVDFIYNSDGKFFKQKSSDAVEYVKGKYE